MFKIDYRFDIGAILLASVLTAVGISDAHAGGKAGIQGDTPTSRPSASASAELAGSKPGTSSGSGLRSRGGAAASARHESGARRGAGHTRSREATVVAPEAISAWPPPPAEAGAAWPPPPRDAITLTGGKPGGVVGSRK